jgi:hypothetical protein
MRKLAVGGDRDQLLVILELDGRRQSERFVVPTKERNDHQLVSDFLTEHSVDYASLDCYFLLAVPHSKTTVRVDATLLGSSGWYFGKPLVIEPIDDLVSVDPNRIELPTPPRGTFDPQVLTQLP